MESPTLQGVSFKSPLWQMTQTTGTCLSNDSAAEAELEYEIDHGAVLRRDVSPKRALRAKVDGLPAVASGRQNGSEGWR